MTHHTHRAVSSMSRTVAWTHCVARPGVGCSGAAHGGVTHVDRCRCGAERETEINGLHVVRGAWTEAERPSPAAPAGPRKMTAREALLLSERHPTALVGARIEEAGIGDLYGSAWDVLREADREQCSCWLVCTSRVVVTWSGTERAIVE